MSWMSYVDSVIEASKNHIEEATIIGLDGSIWTVQDPNTRQVLNVSQQEATTIANIMCPADETISTTLSADGIHAAGVRYLFLRDLLSDGRIMCGRAGRVNITIARTSKAIIMAKGREGGEAGLINIAVDNLMKYLMGQGY